MITKLPYLFLILFLLAGCQSVDNDDNPDDNGGIPTVSVYEGPAANTDDVARFQENVWENLSGDHGCGNCHGLTGIQQSPQFARDDDINLAYEAALTVVDRINLSESVIVKEVEDGHNCWKNDYATCGALMEVYLNAWINPTTEEPVSNEIVLTAPSVTNEPASGKQFPDDSSAFASTVWPLLTQHCADCHTDSASTPQAPYIAHSNVDVAYNAVRTGSRIDLNTPANSRLVLRLIEFHQCWSGTCQDDANTMLLAITSYGNSISPPDALDPALVNSKALKLHDGIVASGGNRYNEDLIAFYEFKAGSGNTLYDTSGVNPALDLTLTGNENVDFQWVGGWGIEFFSGHAYGSSNDSSKLAEHIRASDAYTIEAWVVPANVSQEGPARIISYSSGDTQRNFTLGQTLYNYDFDQRSSSTNANGDRLSTPDDDEVLQATQQHVAITYSPPEGRKVYVNGELVASEAGTMSDHLNDWDDGFSLLFGGEAGGSSLWQGKLRMVAIHEKALTITQIQQNMNAGVGERYFLLFSLGVLVTVPDSYIMLEVSQFDNYSYLFHTPTFVTLSDSPGTIDIDLRAMRIGINGEESAVGQVYRYLNLVDDFAVNEDRQVFSEHGTIIPLQKGAEFDEFFLTFEKLGIHENVALEALPIPPATPADGETQSRIALRSFAEINATMSVLTDVASTQGDVQTTYTTIMQQLPVDNGIEGFLASHQIAVSQLAIEYCNALIEDTSLRISYFPGFDFTTTASIAFDNPTKRDQLIDPLITRINGDNLITQADPAEIKDELNSLISRLTECATITTTCDDSARTLAVAKSSCAALLASATMMVQ